MSKFLSLGAPLMEVVRAATETPAKAIGRPELGTLKPGSPGDAVVLRHEEGAFDYLDSLGKKVTGAQKLAPEAIVLGGAFWA